jgi:hypothetical protein
MSTEPAPERDAVDRSFDRVVLTLIDVWFGLRLDHGAILVSTANELLKCRSPGEAAAVQWRAASRLATGFATAMGRVQSAANDCVTSGLQLPPAVPVP